MKYVIDTEQISKGNTAKSLYVCDGNGVSIDKLNVDNLEILDGDYVNEHFGDLQDQAAQVALNLAARICLNKTDYEGAYTAEELKGMFGTPYAEDIIKNFTARQIFDTTDAYDMEKARVQEQARALEKAINKAMESFRMIEPDLVKISAALDKAVGKAAEDEN